MVQFIVRNNDLTITPLLSLLGAISNNFDFFFKQRWGAYLGGRGVFDVAKTMVSVLHNNYI